MSPLAILSIVIVLVLPVPGDVDGLHSGDVRGDADADVCLLYGVF